MDGENEVERRGIKGGASSFGPTLCSGVSRLPASDKEYRHVGYTRKREPFEGRNFWKGIIVPNDITTIFTIFLAILEKSGLVNLLVRLINKLYPTRHYFQVYAWMFL